MLIRGQVPHFQTHSAFVKSPAAVTPNAVCLLSTDAQSTDPLKMRERLKIILCKLHCPNRGRNAEDYQVQGNGHFGIKMEPLVLGKY